MITLRTAQLFAALGVPLPVDMALDLRSQGFDPETLKPTNGGTR